MGVLVAIGWGSRCECPARITPIRPCAPPRGVLCRIGLVFVAATVAVFPLSLASADSLQGA